jgi:hypothetical protein
MARRGAVVDEGVRVTAETRLRGVERGCNGGNGGLREAVNRLGGASCQCGGLTMV